MKVSEYIDKLSLEIVAEGDLSKEIKGCYCSDLLSHCMSNIETNNVWITVQTNINVVAIAVLTELSCIVVAQEMPVDEAVINKAVSEGVTILRSPEAAYELCVKTGEVI